MTENSILPTSGRILCCLCGISIIPNAAAMCIPCLQTQVDITEGIPKEGEIVFCKKCERWQVGPDHWVAHELESNGLLAVLMKKIAAFSDHKLKVVEAAWVWTEHHSKRLKFVVDIEKGVLDDKVTLRQKVFVEYVIKNKQCLDCIHENTDHTWGALLQLRQGGGSKKTFHHLESQLNKHGLYNLMLDVTVVKEGLDIYFKTRAQADKVLDFVQSVLPTKLTKSKKLVSRDLSSNTARYELTYLVEVVPLHRGDLVVVSKALAGRQDIYLVHKISSLVHCLQPQTLQMVEFSAAKYFSLVGTNTSPAIIIATERQLHRFLVLDITPVRTQERSGEVPSKSNDAAGVIAEAVIAREEDMTEYTITTHLGHLLQPGDIALGYDVQHLALGLAAESAMQRLRGAVPEVVLVRKFYDEKNNAGGVRKSKKKNRVPPWRRDKEKQENDDVDTEATVVNSVDASALRREEEEAEVLDVEGDGDGEEEGDNEADDNDDGDDEDWEDEEEEEENAEDYEPAFVDDEMEEVK